MVEFEIREGNGNDGLFRYCGRIQAKDAFEALRKASRVGAICKPRVVRVADIEGDSTCAHLTDYREGYNGCRWTAEARLIS